MANEKGLTLVEILASIILLSIIFISIFAFFTNSFQFNSINDENIQAMNIAREEQAWLSKNGLQNIEATRGYTKNVATPDSFERSVLVENVEYNITITIKPESGNLYKPLNKVHIAVSSVKGKSETYTYVEGA